uniref:Uncharacterized protein n=1 Tax=viral metagenome TaxID=1070528 RepID=A0A6M3JH89_9ZZZZ
MMPYPLRKIMESTAKSGETGTWPRGEMVDAKRNETMLRKIIDTETRRFRIIGHHWRQQEIVHFVCGHSRVFDGAAPRHGELAHCQHCETFGRKQNAADN